MTELTHTAFEAIHRIPVSGIPTPWLNIMEHSQIDRIAGVPPGTYRKHPYEIYLAMQRAIGVSLLDQFIPDNPLTMADAGFETQTRSATTGAERIVLDGMQIDTPEDAVAHMERFVFPAIQRAIATFDHEKAVQRVLNDERSIQEQLGPSILKTGYGHARFPYLRYGAYGYMNYFMAYALFPEVMERDFQLQADFSLLQNRAVAHAIELGNLPKLYRLDHDMADSRGTLVSIQSLDRIWFPHFTRCIAPLLEADVALLWHCDGNLMQMLPRLLDIGFSGFQGFQYEDGMDYEKICRMKTRDGQSPLIWAGVSVTRTLPIGTPEDVTREIKWLADNGPRTGLFIGVSSSIVPGVPWENMQALIEGLQYLQTHGAN